MQTITAHKTNDGKLFEDKQAALDHEKSLESWDSSLKPLFNYIISKAKETNARSYINAAIVNTIVLKIIIEHPEYDQDLQPFKNGCKLSPFGYPLFEAYTKSKDRLRYSITEPYIGKPQVTKTYEKFDKTIDQALAFIDQELKKHSNHYPALIMPAVTKHQILLKLLNTKPGG